MRIAYFVNQYPMVSHSFIRREILALEKLGCNIARIALRSNPKDLVDPRDISEYAKTRFILKQPIFTIIKSVLLFLIRYPFRLSRALWLTIKIGWNSERGIVRHIFYFIEACVLAMWMKAEKIQHVHAHFGTNSTTVAMLASELSSIPYSFTVHGPEEFDKPVALSLSEKIKRAAFVVAISSFGKSQLSRWVDHKFWQKLNVVHCGLDGDFFSFEHSPVEDVPRLVCIGRLCEQKAQPLLMEAVHKLKQNGRDFELVLAGDGPLRTKIEDMIEQYGLQTTVKITGWISSEEVRDQLLKARAMVLPSFAEGLPVVIMEAMAIERPVISTYIAGIPELVIPEENGWLVTAGDVEALCVALEDVLDKKVEELREMGKKARHRVLERHDVDREAAKLLSLFNKSVQDNAPTLEKT